MSKSINTNKFGNIVLVACLAAIMTATAWLFPSSSQIGAGDKIAYKADINAIIEADILNQASIALKDIYELPEVYILPVSCEPSPKPDQSCYDIVDNSDGIHIDSGTYTDQTISVKVWKEQRDNTIYNYADVQIAHPTQLRTMFASGSYEMSNLLETPKNIAIRANAVVAINSDFCRYNGNGSLLIRGGNLYNYNPRHMEVLLIDNKGDFHFVNDAEVEIDTSGSEAVCSGITVYNSISFGPVLVRDGKAIEDFKDVPAAIHGMYLSGKNKVARAAIGQIGELHYILCTVDGTRNEQFGVVLPQLAKALEEKGCISAYNLDGGHSATLVFNNRLVNIPAAKDNTGDQRAQSDIIYFASALPEN